MSVSRPLTLPASAVVLALLLAACGGSDKPKTASTASQPATHGSTARSTTVLARTPRLPPSPREIERAARATAREPGFRANLTATIYVPQLTGVVTAIGRGRFDPHSGSGTLDVSVGLPGLIGLVGPLPTQLRLVGREAYAKVPAGLGSDLGTSAGWLQESISDLGLGDSLNPKDVLREIGRDATRPVPNQRARVTITPATGLVRTIALTYTAPGGYHVHVRLTLTGFGPEPATRRPPPARVGDLKTALQTLGF